MTLLFGLLYILYFMTLGYGIRATYNWAKQKTLNTDKKTDFFAHAFFQGIFFHVVIFNLFQLLNFSNTTVVWILSLILLFCFTIIVRHIINSGMKGQTLIPNFQQILIASLVLFFSSFIYWNGSLLPNIAWDSWAVWEGNAQQWVHHGLSAEIVQWSGWLENENAIFNRSANYPDGLSLIYFLPNYLVDDGFAAAYLLALFGFAMMTFLLIRRIAMLGAPLLLQVSMVLVIYTTPFISNHLMIQGYADIWMSMYILLIMLCLVDYADDRQTGLGLTVICYLAMLPMLKLEGWVWLLLFILAYLLIVLINHRHKYKIYSGIVVSMLVLIIMGGINLEFAFGELVITPERITLFNLFDMQIQFVNITDALLTSFFWQNNWSLLWLGLPFLLFSFFSNTHNNASQISHVFLILALLCFLFLFYFTEASQWALDFTAINRVVLQLTPSYLFLLFTMVTRMKNFHPTKKSVQQPST